MEKDIKQGKIYCYSTDAEFYWEIENFSSLSETVNCYHCSPMFDFGGRSWFLILYPNGKIHDRSVGFVGLYLRAIASGPPFEIQYSLGIKAANEETEVWLNTKAFEKNGVGNPKCILRSEIIRRREELAPLDCITLIATLKTDKEEAVKKGAKDVFVQTVAEDDIAEDDKGSPSQKTGGEKVLQDIRRLWLSGDSSDVVIKVGDVEFKAHRAILGIRTPVLSAMFKHDTAEKASGEVTIDDCEPAAFEQLLHYIYTGAPRELNEKNAAALYVVADKYLLSEVKYLCVRCMLDTLSLKTFCDVVKLSLVHKEVKLLETAIDFFSKNMVDVLKTVEWQLFLREYSTWANEILIRALEPEARNEAEKP